MASTKKLTKVLRAALAAKSAAPKPAAVALNLKTSLRRHVTLTRGEEAKAVIVAVPKPNMLSDYRKSAGDDWDADHKDGDGAPGAREQAVERSMQDLFDAVNALTLKDFRITRDPEFVGAAVVVHCSDQWLSKKFDFRMHVEDEWRSDGGESNIHDEVYSTRLDPRW